MDIFLNLSVTAQLALAFAAGALFTFVIMGLLLRSNSKAFARKLIAAEADLESSQQLSDRFEEDLKSAETELANLKPQLVEVSTKLEIISEQRDRFNEREEVIDRELQQLREQKAQLETRLSGERKQAEEKIAILNEAKDKLTVEFKNLANEIFEEKSRRFTEQNRSNLETVLKPLSGQIKDFQKRVEETYDKESKDRFSLVKEIKSLQELNSRISEDAVNLTNALKGESKTQGTWGELKLEKILEASGLVKGREYDVQVSMKNEEGARLQPDVVVHLPENKDVIIDSKVTLTAYHRYISADTDEEREKQAVQHLHSLQKHIKDLSSKDYQNIEGVRTLDFVLMFLPVEDAFNLAVQRDVDLFSRAFENNIVLVGPSTLLATLRTIQHIWRNEYQTQNAQEIAKRAGDLYDKFVNFVSDLEEVGQRLDKAQDAYEKAHNKLASGRGNLVNRAETLKKLGAKTSKALPKSLLGKSDQGLEVVELKDSQAKEPSP